MDKRFKHTPLARTLDLYPLESVLTAAERMTPSRAPRPGPDPNEVLAAQLIERIKHPVPASLPSFQIEPPQPLARVMNFTMAGTDV